MNKPVSKCLINNHKIKTVRKMNDYIKRCRQGTIKKCKKYNCLKMAEKLLKALGDKWNPIKCTPYKDNLDPTPRRKEANENIGDGPTPYNPDMMEKGEPEKAVRIFLNKPEEGEENLKPVYRKHTYPQEQWTLYTDGACLVGIPQEPELVQECSAWKMEQKTML